MRYKKRDKLFDKEYPPSQFTFDAKVAEVFDDMVSRSVPLYKETMKAVINLSKTFVKNNSSVYDIGCSTGTLLSQCENNFKNKSVKYFGIDSSLHMLKEAKKKFKNKENIFLLQQNIENELNIKNASVIFMNYTLQFVRPIKREKVLKRIFDGMTNNSAFFLVEKTLSSCKQLNQTFIDLYHSYKLTVGYTNLVKKKEKH